MKQYIIHVAAWRADRQTRTGEGGYRHVSCVCVCVCVCDQYTHPSFVLPSSLSHYLSHWSNNQSLSGTMTSLPTRCSQSSFEYHRRRLITSRRRGTCGGCRRRQPPLFLHRHCSQRDVRTSERSSAERASVSVNHVHVAQRTDALNRTVVDFHQPAVNSV